MKWYRLTPPSICSIEIEELMKQCWMENPKERPNFQYLLTQLKSEYEKLKKQTFKDVSDISMHPVEQQYSNSPNQKQVVYN